MGTCAYQCSHINENNNAETIDANEELVKFKNSNLLHLMP